MLSRTVKSCGPDASTPASSQRRQNRPNRVRRALSAGDGDNQARSPGRSRNRPLKPSRVGAPGDPVDLWWLHSCATTTLHTRLRVQRAPGVPHTLISRPWDHAQLGRIRREIAGVWPRACGCLKGEAVDEAPRGMHINFRHSGSRAAAVRNGDLREADMNPSYIFSCPAGAAVPCCWRSCSLAWWRP
jgi:hypothetical protein